MLLDALNDGSRDLLADSVLHAVPRGAAVLLALRRCRCATGALVTADIDSSVPLEIVHYLLSTGVRLALFSVQPER